RDRAPVHRRLPRQPLARLRPQDPDFDLCAAGRRHRRRGEFVERGRQFSLVGVLKMKKTMFFASALSVAALLAGSAMAQDSQVLTGKDAYGDWEKDAPGVMRQLRAEDLEAPNPQESASNFPGTVAQPEGAEPKVPEGFKVEKVASGIANPRAIRFA